ncbi:MAG: hypothetical protein NZ602_14790 [Thermoguttaceae bacterium]|nr:hypothetical protein [Thermoguttaceae bacterium]MDW8039142.1 hypothetical protein [Thermoguttaceae bacterium]
MRSMRKAGGWRLSSELSLFPFLAVLICVMGGLIVLLVVLARHGRMQAIRVAQAASNQKKISLQDLEQQRELLQWQAEQIRESRSKTESQLAEARLQLSGAEDHLRRLREELEQLQRAWQALKQSVDQSEDPASLEDRLRQMRAEIVRLKQQAEQKKQSLQPQVSYAIIPYEGPHGTRRRPIYIECREDAVILQPEGIVLTAKDFEGPLTQENPLARAVRAVREYWAAQAGSVSEAQEPYPMLLVRPDGIVAYYTAREALQEWGSEFGYELIGQDWQLRFPPADPQLAKILRQEVELARARQELLAKIAPRVASRSKPVYRLSPRGIQLEDLGDGRGSPGPRTGPTVPPHHPKKFPPPSQEAMAGDRSFSGRAEFRNGLADGGAESALAAERISRSAEPGSEPSRQNSSPWPQAEAGTSSPGTQDYRSQPSGQTGGWAGQLPGAYSATKQSAEASGPGRSPSDSASLPGGTMGPPAGGNLFGSIAGAVPLQENSSTQPGPMRSRGLGPPTTWLPSEGAQAGGSFSAAPQWRAPLPGWQTTPSADRLAARPRELPERLRPGEWYDPPPHRALDAGSESENISTKPRPNQSKAGVSAQPLRSVRGRNWALPEAADKAIPITRPIQVDFYPDRLILSPGTPQQKEIRWASKPLDTLDELVNSVWEYIESWGIAGRGMYWRPVLSVRVAPGAEEQFRQLQILLEDSGLLIERRE